MIAFRYLRAKRKEGFISIIALFAFLGMTLGVAALIIVMSVMNGFHTELMKRILGINAHVTISHNTGLIEDYDALSAQINNLQSVKKASPVVKGQVLASTKGANSGAVVFGMNLDDLKAKPLVADNIKFGSLDDMEEWGGVAIGSRMSNMFNLLPGDTIRLISPKTTNTFIINMPRMKDYKVAAVFDVGMTEYDSGVIFMPLSEAKRYFKTDGKVNSIEIYGHNPSAIPQITADIMPMLKGEFGITDWQRANANFFNSLKVERVVMFVILTLIIIVAAFNVVSGMAMLVIVKKKEIAILRTIGVTRGGIMRIFFMCGAIIGIFGTLFGYIIGVSFALNIENIRQWLQNLTGTELFDPVVYYLSKLPSDVRSEEVLAVVIVALAISIIAPLFPARKAAKVNPAEGVRGE